MQTIDSHFIGNFKDGDNICYNLEVINALYTAYRDTQTDNEYFRKPIILFLVAIVEAALDDLFYKIRKYTNEGVPNIPNDQILQIRSNPSFYRKFEAQIRFIRRNDLFELGETNFYSVLDDLRKIRNRLHIQNNYRDSPFDERHVFTESRLLQAEKVCEYTLKHMSAKHPRQITARNYVDDFTLPWNAHFDF